MEIINVGTNEDGTPHLLYHAPGEHVVITPQGLSGSVTLPDGKIVDVSPRCIVVDSEAEGAEIVQALAEQHQGLEVGADAFSTPLPQFTTENPEA
jgi:hypothetical protein